MNPYANIQLMETAIPTLFVCDPDGRLRYIREPGYPEAELDPAPRFFMGRTGQGNIWRFRHDLPSALVGDLEQLCGAEPITPILTDQPHNAATIRAVLETHAPINAEERGPAYWIPSTVSVPGQVVLISQANAEFLEANFDWTLRWPFGLTMGPITAVIVEDAAVSICFCARFTQVAAEAGVETVEGFRGQGYASAVVAAWATAIHQRGMVPLYSTNWQNMASQGVARKIEMLCYGEHWSIM